MRLAIIGTGVAGLTAAHLLCPEHDVTIFEANGHVGGHVNTVEVACPGGLLAVDTGFIVFNDRTYPCFLRLLDRIGAAWQPSDMSFSVACADTGLEYNGGSLSGLFAQRRNFLSLSFLRMLRDILHFNRRAPRVLQDSGHPDITLGEYLESQRYSREFVRHYLLPMGSAIWSMPTDRMKEFPLRYFVRFFQNHGLLNIVDRPQWRVIVGGSKQYVARLIQPFRQRIRLNTPVLALRRDESGVTVYLAGDRRERFDQVILATHGDQALRLLQDPSPAEQRILGAFRFQRNEAVLHTDTALMPKNRRAWASWNYHLLKESDQGAVLTYWMNRLQSLPGPENYLVTLNRTEGIQPEKIISKITYYHPVVSVESTAAQNEWEKIQAKRRTFYCGAYWGFGFHEDGVVSGLRVAKYFGKSL